MNYRHQIFVSNLNYSTSEAALSAWFQQNGYEVASVRILFDLDKQRSKGYGFLDLRERNKVTDAITDLNGQTLDGRTLWISEADHGR
jgi:nucleolin